MTSRLFKHVCHTALHIKIVNTIETQQLQGLTVSEAALNV